MYTQEVQCGPRKYNLHHCTTNISLNLDPCFHVFTPILLQMLLQILSFIRQFYNLLCNFSESTWIVAFVSCSQMIGVAPSLVFFCCCLCASKVFRNALLHTMAVASQLLFTPYQLETLAFSSNFRENCYLLDFLSFSELQHVILTMHTCTL